MQAGHDRFGIRELRDRSGRDEARRLDLAHAGVGQQLDEVELVIGPNDGGLGLQAVARADLVDPDLARRHAGR